VWMLVDGALHQNRQHTAETKYIRWQKAYAIDENKWGSSLSSSGSSSSSSSILLMLAGGTFHCKHQHTAKTKCRSTWWWKAGHESV
jgi:hypothetical protein